MSKIRVYGTEYEVPDMEQLTTKELRTIKENTGMGLRPLLRGMAEWDADALVAVVYVAKVRAGEKVSWSDFDDLRPLVDIEDIEDADEPDGSEPEQEGGKSNPPTGTSSTGSGTSRTRGSQTTSRSSRTTSTSTPDK